MLASGSIQNEAFGCDCSWFVLQFFLSPQRDSLLYSYPDQGCKYDAYLWLPQGMGEMGKYSLETKMWVLTAGTAISGKMLEAYIQMKKAKLLTDTWKQVF